MADEPKQPWYKSIPGILTAATGFIAALSGLVAGLNQLGVFRREPPPAVVGINPAPGDKTAQDSVGPAPPARPGASPGESLRSPVPAPAPTPAPSQPPATPKPAPAPRPTPRSPASDTAGEGTVVIPKGTTITVTVPSRACAPAEGARRVAARVATPVEVRGATVLPAGTTAVLRLRRAGRPPELRVRLDSLVRAGRSLAISSAQVQVPRASADGFCLEAGGRVTAVLGESVTVARS